MPSDSIPNEAIDVWHLPLTSERAEITLLSADERTRLERLRIDSKKVQFCAARGQMRRILARYLDAAPESLRFEYGEHGKPSLRDHPDLEFNLSHSGRAGLLGVARGTPIGVDVEWHKPDRRFADIAARFFTTQEHSALMRLPEDARPAAFYRAWACKEAYLKAWGTGLSFPSDGFTIDYVGSRPPRILATDMPGDRPDACRLRAVRTFDGHAAAVCFTGEARWLRHFSPGDCSGAESG
jgi:4'-phosphopantetheinyl transferase